MDFNTNHRWQFFRAGGFDQVFLTSAADLAALKHLDQKLWASLACPVVNLALDSRMLSYMDINKDGRIRAPELLAAIDWTLKHLKDPDILFRDEALTLTAFSDSAEGAHLQKSARRLLQIMGRTDHEAITPADTDDLSVLFPEDKANGDGLVPLAFTDEDDLKQAISDIISSMGAEVDRSGAEAISEEKVNAFFDLIGALIGWQNSDDSQALRPFGDTTADAMAAIGTLKQKIDDYFTRVEMAEYDPRAKDIMNGDEAELVRLAALDLADTSELEPLPLAGIHNGRQLPLEAGVNPAWKGAMALLKQAAVLPVFGDIDSITREQWQQLVARGQQYFSWKKDNPDIVLLDSLSKDRIQALASNNVHERLLELIEKDKTVSEAAEGLVDLDKLMRFQRGLITLLRNFISFQDFYGREEKAIFQAGRLFIDGKSCDLVVEVNDVNAHSAIANKSNSFLIYCQCTRRGEPVNGKETIHIVAAITAGADHELMVGRNGLFYDRDNNDWDATVVKLVENSISVREAFWSPYKRIASMISEQLQKLAANRDQEMMSDAATKVATPGEAPKPFDIARFAGIFAAIGLAVGALGTALAAMMSGLLSLTWWQWPLVFLAIILIISCPSMLMAWFKLRRRSLGPILDANGWAVNTQARISIAFGESLTQLASLPKGSALTLRDPYAPKRGWILPTLILIAALALGGWLYYSKVYMPKQIAAQQAQADQAAAEQTAAQANKEAPAATQESVEQNMAAPEANIDFIPPEVSQ